MDKGWLRKGGRGEGGGLVLVRARARFEKQVERGLVLLLVGRGTRG